jgi:hypothetical protein
MEFNGLPLHVLLVHAVVILLPLAVLCAVLHAAWPAAGRRLGIVTPILAIVSTILVPITTNAGEWLQARVGQTPLLAIHAALGDTLLPWAVALSVVTVVEWVWFRFGPAPDRSSAETASGRRRVRLAIRIVLIVAALIVATGTVVTTVQIGESGARAVWSGSVSGG